MGSSLAIQPCQAALERNTASPVPVRMREFASQAGKGTCVTVDWIMLAKTALKVQNSAGVLIHIVA